MSRSPVNHFVLVVEASERLRLRMADALVSRGYVVHTSPSSEAASALAQQVNFGVVVIGPSELAGGFEASVRLLTRQPGLKRALVMYDPARGSSKAEFAPGVLQEVDSSKQGSVIDCLRLAIPDAADIDAERPSGKKSR